jgi:membrane-associated phospholipid phosphatase
VRPVDPDNDTAPIRVRGLVYIFLVAAAVALSAVVLDMPVGTFRNQWPQSLTDWCLRLTDFTRTVWVLSASGVMVLLALGIRSLVPAGAMRALAARCAQVVMFIFLSVAAAGLVTTLLKWGIGRARPVHYEALGAFHFQPFTDDSFASFPSGHATTAGALFAALALLAPRYRNVFLVVAAGLASCRIVVGMHYLSDVVAGLAIGAWIAYFTASMFARYGILFTADRNGWPVRRPGLD